MSTGSWMTPVQQITDTLSLCIASDPPGRTETPALPKPRIAIHLGRSVFMACHRAGLKHRGWAVHGDIDVVPANTSCIWEPDGRDTALIVSLHPELLATTAADFGVTRGELNVLNRFQTRDSQIENICWALKAEMEMGYPTGRIFLDSLATALAASLVRRHSSLQVLPCANGRATASRRLRRALSYIEENLNRDMSLAAIAQAAELSISHLKATFRETTGVPVHQYVIQRRVERASILLREGKLSISEIANETGFAHPSHLAKHVRRLLGCSPKEIRDL